MHLRARPGRAEERTGWASSLIETVRRGRKCKKKGNLRDSEAANSQELDEKRV